MTSLYRIFLFVTIFVFPLSLWQGTTTSPIAQVSATAGSSFATGTNSPDALGNQCHFGIGAPFGVKNISNVGVGYMINWGGTKPSNLPSSITHLPVIRLGDKDYDKSLANVRTMVANKPGGFWILGNEPDSEVDYQDNITAETYGERYYQIATIIRQVDPSAKLGFGAIIQPTAIRLHYLDLALNQMASHPGGMQHALSLIDVYTIHAFIMDEEAHKWGSGVPKGYDPSTWPAGEIINVLGSDAGKAQTHSIDLFKTRIIRFRQWMKSHNQNTKALYITEYGSLLPSYSIYGLSVSMQDTATFMIQSFDLLLSYKDANLGLASDSYRLVQMWVWYSLTEKLDNFGGPLYELYQGQITYVGDKFINYNPDPSIVPVTDPDVFVVSNSMTESPIFNGASKEPLGHIVTFGISNTISSDRNTMVQVALFEGSKLIGTNVGRVPRCSGTSLFSIRINGSHPGEVHQYTVKVAPLAGNGTDVQPANNTLTFAPITFTGIYQQDLPHIQR